MVYFNNGSESLVTLMEFIYVLLCSSKHQMPPVIKSRDSQVRISDINDSAFLNISQVGSMSFCIFFWTRVMNFRM